MSILGPIITCICLLSASGAPALGAESSFAVWLDELRTEAISSGISPETVEAALTDIEEPLPRVIELDRTQPESTQTLEDYVADRVNEKRIVNGSRMLSRYPTWLGRVERKYGVRRRFIVALWGIESSYGEHAGGYPVIRSLVTLAHDGRRSAYFRRELLDALRILDAGHISLKDLKGSWAGAMGQCQFMPSSFLRYAVDADGDGRIDIWSSVPDVLASTANYLARVGWQDGLTWGRPVLVPERFDLNLTGLEKSLPLRGWQALGVRRQNGKALPRRDLDASLILPEGPGGPAYLVYANFRALLAWNRSKAFAVAVGTLSDRLAAQQEKGKPSSRR
ncbi:lytic murein transglycosylase [Desulfuromonas soudanensis]|uniref:Lytic murein transglycosylase n=1 Tax=Desulfuromonas soudanensis TaxID=1603606 RepID=A0A0M4DFC6_9BACT|nr:lytic murein transglycosylase [Desulfuromonas soudanensis]ALC15195.1 lytic murein transglycosylase [Desulfuromonas soudanensis]